MRHVQGKPERDKHVIEAVVRRFGPVSRSRIHELTAVRKSAVTALVRELLDDGRLVEVGRAANGKATGRKEVLLALNEGFRYIGAVEFDEETVTAGILDLHPSIRAVVEEPANLAEGMEGLARQLVRCTRKALSRAGLGKGRLVGVGVADPGLVDSRRGVTVTSSTIGFWRDVPLEAMFEREFGAPALVETKTRAKAVAERVLGAGGMCEEMVYVDYGVGIGAGLILDGKLMHGRGGAAGEFGHTAVTAGGPACSCGSCGCLEALAGARAVVRRMRAAVERGGGETVLEAAGGDPERITVRMVLEAARKGDDAARAIAAEMAAHLGLALGNVVNLFNPSAIVLDSRLAAGGPKLLEQVEAAMRRQALGYSSEGVAVRFGELGGRAGILGLALMFLERHFEIPMLRPPKYMIEGVEPEAGVQFKAAGPGPA